MAQRPSDEAVKAATGKIWSGWFKILDIANATKMNHTAIAALLYENLGCPAWWNQMIANQYEQERGMRKKHETADGYRIGVSKTFPLPVSKLFTAFEDRKIRDQWLKGGKIELTTTSRNKSIRARWGVTRIDIDFHPKGDGKCQVSIGQSRIADGEAAEKMKAYWAKALEKLYRRSVT
ncbi:MAG: hypothetical protein U0R44_00360 [Candidatus Micrarchaeia archaeon]